MSIQFENNCIEAGDLIAGTADSFLYEAAELIKSQTAQLTKVKTGQLKGSWDYVVDSSEKRATVGSELENSIWNEFGTGEYAAAGNGRKGGWKYKDEYGVWHFTKGKIPRHTLQTAFTLKKNAIIDRARQLFGEIGK